MASRFNREAKLASQILSTLLGKRSCNTSMAATSSSALLLNPLTSSSSSSSLRRFRCSPEISSLSFSSARVTASDFSLAMKRQSRSFADGSERDPSVVCEAVKRETGADGLKIADNVSQVRWFLLPRIQIDGICREESIIGDQIFSFPIMGMFAKV